MMSEDEYAEMERLRHQVKGLGTEAHYVERILADTLRFPYSEPDDAESPCPGEYAVGDHTPTTMAMTAAEEIMRLRGDPELDDAARQAQLNHWFNWDQNITADAQNNDAVDTQ